MNKEILALYRAYNEAIAKDDTVQLDKLIAPSFTLTHMTGYVQSRAAWLQELTQGTMHYFSSVEDHVEMVSADEGWRVRGQNRVVASIHGSGAHEWPLNSEMIVQKIAGQWQIMSVVVTTY